MVSYLDFCYYFEVNGQNHILLRLLQVLKEKHSMTFSDHFSASWNLCIPSDLGESESKCLSSRQDKAKVLEIHTVLGFVDN